MNKPAAEISPIGGKTGQASPMERAEAVRCCRAIRDHLDSARVLVLELYDRDGWKALGYGSWRECVVEEFGQSQSHLYRQLDAALIERDISPIGGIGSVPERQLRPLASVPPEDRKPVWDLASQTAPGGKLTAKHVESVVKKVAPRPPRPEPAARPAPRPSTDALDAAIAGVVAGRPAPSVSMPDGVDDPGEVLVESVGDVDPEADDGPGDMAGELSDAEFLARCPARASLSDECLGVFDRDAILFHRATPDRRDFHERVQAAVAESRPAAGARAGGYAFRLRKFLAFPDPTEWRVCDHCQGDGKEPPLSRCHKCYGAGYLQ